MRVLALLVLLSACAAPEQIRRRDYFDAIRDGVSFLLQTQNSDGSWGTGKVTRGFEIYSMVPGSHDAFRVATTALCVMALRKVGEREAHDRGVEYLVTRGEARRDDGNIIYNVWAHTYALEALSGEMASNPDPRIRTAAKWHLDRLVRYETVSGGWFYYDFEAHTATPSEGSTSFNAAAGLLALQEARQAGLEVPQGLTDRAFRRLEQMRNPDGSYLYGMYMLYHPRQRANRLRGSIGRAQAGNLALWSLGSKAVGEKESFEGLERFFDEHVFLEIGRKRQFPHEAWYATSGYYYYFGHFYAGRLIGKLGESGLDFIEDFDATILPYQEPDGSWWDYAMWDYDKPYGTALALLGLLHSRGADGYNPVP